MELWEKRLGSTVALYRKLASLLSRSRYDAAAHQAGGSDEAIVPLSDQVFAGLKRLNKNATYLRYDGEGHGLAQYANRLDYWNRVLAFLGQIRQADAT